MFLFFAYLRATELARENNRFSMLKNRGADKTMGHSATREIRHVETRFIASHPLGAKPRHDIPPHRGAGLEEAELSVTAGGAKRNPRYAHTLR